MKLKGTPSSSKIQRAGGGGILTETNIALVFLLFTSSFLGLRFHKNCVIRPAFLMSGLIKSEQYLIACQNRWLTMLFRNSGQEPEISKCWERSNINIAWRGWWPCSVPLLMLKDQDISLLIWVALWIFCICSLWRWTSCRVYQFCNLE